jgi:hypothetical protein
MPDEPINYYREAFMEPMNLVFLITALVVAVMLSGGLLANVLMLFAAAAELMYLGTLPRNERYRKVVRSRKAVEERTRPTSQHNAVAQLNPEDRRRYVRFRKYEEGIRDSFSRLSYASRGLLDGHLQKLDRLLDQYLQLLMLKERYSEYQYQTDEGQIVNAIETLQAEIAASESPRVAAVQGRRLSILQKRLDLYKKAGENLAVIDGQLRTIEEVTLYLRDQALTMQNPENVSFQLDTLVSEVEETQASVAEIEDLFSGDIAGITEQDLADFDASRADMARIEQAKAQPRVDSGLLEGEGPTEAPREERRERERE